MRSVPPLFLLGLGLAVGLAAGIWLQRRWPLGRVRAELSVKRVGARVAAPDLARLSPDRRLVLVCIGQSHAANYGEPRAAAGANVDAFADGQLFSAIAPLPAGDGYGGSIWTRLGAKLALTTKAEAIIFAVVAEGSTHAADWAPGGRHHECLLRPLRQLGAAGLPADFILWQQGEQEGRVAAVSAHEYARELAAVHETTRQFLPDGAFLVAQATVGAVTALNEQYHRLSRSFRRGAGPLVPARRDRHGVGRRLAAGAVPVAGRTG